MKSTGLWSLHRSVCILLLLFLTETISLAQVGPFKSSFVEACLGGRIAAPCDIVHDERSTSDGIASINATYGSPAMGAQLGVNATADSSVGVLRSRTSCSFDISGPPTNAFGAAFAIFQDVITIDFQPMRGRTGLLLMKYVLSGNTSTIKNARAFADVKTFVFRPDNSLDQKYLALYSSSVSGLFPVTVKYTFGQPFALRFDLVTNCGTLTPTLDPPSGILLIPGVGQGAGTADFANTFTLAAVEAFDEDGNPLPFPPSITSVSGTQYTTNGVLKSFADLFAKIEINQPERKIQTKASFALAIDSNGINPLTEDITFELGPLSITVPAGSFRSDNKGRFKFDGTINNIALEAQIRPLEDRRFEFKVEAAGPTLTAITNPVSLRLIIGDDAGNTVATAEFK